MALLTIAAGALATWVVGANAKVPGPMLTPLIGIMAIAGIVAVFVSAASGPGEDLSAIGDGLRRARRGERPSPPAGASPDLGRVFDDLARFGEEEDRRLREATGREAEIDAATRKLVGGVETQAVVAEDTATLVKDMDGAVRAFSSTVDALTHEAEGSGSSVVQTSKTSAEVASNLGHLATSVRDSMSAIQELAASIKEVARSVDALSLTAEETSSSMNEMDVSIGQVQSNAIETARLSEEVAVDAEKGAEAILKTIAEIFRIKESSGDAVTAISALGSRIDAIGQIVNVIDDVAEQTNLLALNAAIIAAQAGEQGKGFAVVADEIKDLAERAGASTREITDLIKTVQAESKSAITAVQRGAHNVDRGVEVSNDAERALKKILESSKKSTSMVRAIARTTVEQAKGSHQVTDAIGRIAATVQQVAIATGDQARRSELIMSSAETIRAITQQVEQSATEQAKGGRQITTAMESISGLVADLDAGRGSLVVGVKQLTAMITKVEESARVQEAALRQLTNVLASARDR